MGFESPIFLAALAAVAVPVAIHLLYRIRKRVVAFGSLRFLERSLKRSRRRLRLRDALLMLLRAGVVALVALAFARPTLRGEAAGKTDEARHVVFVLDDSLSMSAGTLARTRLEEARERVLGEIAGLAPRDRAALVRAAGAKVASPLTDDFTALAAQVRATGATYSRGDMAGALRAAQGILAASDAPAKQIVIASDLQRTSFGDAALAAMASGAAGEIRIAMQPVELPNLAVVTAECDAVYWTPDSPVVVRAAIANYSLSEETVPVRLRVGPDLAVRAERTVSVPARGVATVELAFTAAAAGSFQAAVSMESNDALAADDERRLVLDLRDRDSLLVLVDRVPRRDEFYFRRGAFLDDGAYFLSRALDPRRGGEDRALSRWEPAEVALRDLDESRLRRARAAVVVSANTLDRERARMLGEFVRTGGGLAVIAYGLEDRATGLLADEGLLAAELGPVIRSAPLEPLGLPMSDWARGHPVWSAFGGDGGPPRARFIEFRALVPIEGAETTAHAEGGRALIALAKTGSGRVATLAFSPAPASTDFPKLRAFVPFVHGLTEHLAGGQRGSARAGGFFVGEGLPGRSMTAIDPDGGRMQDAEHILFDRPGFWQIESQGEARAVAVNVPPEESDLRPMSPDELARAMAEGESPTRIAGANAGDGRGRRPSRLWSAFLAAAVCLLLAETALASRMILGEPK